MEPPKIALKDERQRTDTSLVAERDKVNHSLSNRHKGTEDLIDESVSEYRKEADQTLEADRQTSDKKNNRPSDEKQLTEERQRSNQAVERERLNVDAAHEKERELKSDLSSRLLEEERKLTDKNLSHERAQSDLDSLRHSNLHSNEQQEHSKTKSQLSTRSEFIAIVSHDLRNPIGAASSCAEMLLDNSIFCNLDPKIKQWIEFIKRNTDVSLRIISDLLDMEQMDQGGLQLKKEKHSLHQLIEQSVECFVHAAAAKKILLKSSLIIESDEAFCDYDRILQVLSNLIGNALKFTPEGGAITVSLVAKGTYLQVSINDTGPGISEDKTQQIFERFTQLGAKNRSGLGLGLYISKMLIDAHGGQIWVESKLGAGSTFCFTVNRAQS